MLKAVFFDIDGTLISLNTHLMPESARKAISRVRAGGVKTFICTSRSSQFMANIMRMNLEMDGIVALAGSHCLDSSLRTISCKMMNPYDVARAIVYAQSTAQPIVGLAADSLYIFKREDPRVDFLFEVGGFGIEDVTGNIADLPVMAPDGVVTEEVVARVRNLGIMQVSAFFEHGAEEDMVFETLMPHCHSERWHDAFLDIAGNDGGKGYGLRTMAASFGIRPEECMAVGDGKNDILMLKEAGVSVAMGNAAPELKAVADFVTADVDRDGIALALKKYFPDLF